MLTTVVLLQYFINFYFENCMLERPYIHWLIVRLPALSNISFKAPLILWAGVVWYRTLSTLESFNHPPDRINPTPYLQTNKPTRHGCFHSKIIFTILSIPTTPIKVYKLQHIFVIFNCHKGVTGSHPHTKCHKSMELSGINRNTTNRHQICKLIDYPQHTAMEYILR